MLTRNLVISDKFKIDKEAYTEDGILFNSDFLNNLTVKNAIEKAIEAITKKKLGEKKITFRLKDWGVSRQRYWGCPIPIVYDQKVRLSQSIKKIYQFYYQKMLT